MDPEHAKSVTKITLWSRRDMTLDEILKAVEARELRPIVCQECGFIAAAETDFDAIKNGTMACSECGMEGLSIIAGDGNGALNNHYPWHRCEHCEYAFLWDDDVAKLIAPGLAGGKFGCPNCRKLTD